MQQVTLSAFAAIISSSERARVIKNGAVVFADWGYYLKEHYQEKGFTGDEIVTDLHINAASLKVKQQPQGSICNFRGLRGVSVQ